MGEPDGLRYGPEQCQGCFRGGIVKRSLAMVLLGKGMAIAEACGLDAATRQSIRL
jgi:hypothetical protein